MLKVQRRDFGVTDSHEAAIKAEGFTVQRSKDRHTLIIDLKEIAGSNRYSIPRTPPPTSAEGRATYEYRVEVDESVDEGDTTLICGPKGQRLTPSYQRGNEAQFRLRRGEDFCMVHFSAKGEHVSITEVALTADPDRNFVSLDGIVRYEVPGFESDLSGTQLEQAIAAAASKAFDAARGLYGVYYVAEKKQVKAKAIPAPVEVVATPAAPKAPGKKRTKRGGRVERMKRLRREAKAIAASTSPAVLSPAELASLGEAVAEVVSTEAIDEIEVLVETDELPSNE